MLPSSRLASQHFGYETHVRTPLHKACDINDWPAINAEIASGADIFAIDDRGLTPYLIFMQRGQESSAVELFWIALQINPDIIGKIRRFRISFEIQDENGLTLLTRACQARNEKLIMSLIEAGAKIIVPTKDPKDLPKFVAEFIPDSANSDLVSSKIARMCVHLALSTNTAQTPIHDYLAKIGIYEFNPIIEKSVIQMVQNLLTLGCSADSLEAEAGYSPLHFSAQMRLIELSKVLMQNGAGLLERNLAKVTPLDYIVIKSGIEKAKELVQFAELECGQRLLIRALQIRSSELVRLALSAGAGNLPAANGVTPVGLAVRLGKLQLAVLIFKSTHQLQGDIPASFPPLLKQLELTLPETQRHFHLYTEAEKRVKKPTEIETISQAASAMSILKKDS